MKFRSFDELLRTNAERNGKNDAFVFDAGGIKKSATYEELYRDVLLKKDEYEKSGAGCVGIYGAASYAWAVNVFGAVIAGCQTVLLDPMCEADALKRLLEYADVDFLWSDAFTASAAELVKPLPKRRVNRRENGEGDVLFFTSGTTSSAKAAVLTSSSLCASAWNGQQKLPCSPEDNLLCVLPLNHVFGFVCAMLWPLNEGAAVSIGRGPRAFLEDPKYFRPTIISVVPSLIRFLIGMNALNDNVKTVLVGAGPADAKVLAAVAAKGINLRFGYGLTETSSGVAISCGEDPFAMSVCDDDKISIGEEGEILIECPECIMKGYYKDDEATAAAVQNGVFHTGDFGFFDEDGNLHVNGRIKDVLVLENGNKIFLPEWEEELFAAMGTDEVAITLTDGKLTAVCVDKENKYEIADLKKKLDDFNRTKTIDRQIVLLEKRGEPLPKTATGKVKRWAINAG